MPGLYTPQSSAGVTSFYDAPSKGPKLDPRIIIAAVVAFTVVILVVDHFIL
ncbi:MAG: preprotein translocase subunit Sec61beta [Candidatus Micrarchaeaceae archaeon]|jgi:preprotein translocase subunit Sec61beta|nr:preprotein translocase subunit Sec61beta [Candidatus Micrarchaeota archaeon]HII10172.1 preprotein translocase subunit Sec61beta [Candidatus Micrarchaeota archaeon]